MHAVAAFFASIITFVSGFFAPPLASNSPPDIRASQPAAAAVAQAEIIGDPFNDPDAASAVAAIIPANAPAPAFSPPPAQTVINQPVIERIIERVVPQGNAGISADTLTAILTDFGQSIEARLAAINPPKADIPQQVAAAGNSRVSGFFPASQRIDQLSNTAITAPTITGGEISGASSVGASSGSFDALSAGTLALSGTLTGTDATFSGTLTAGILNVAGLSSQGALTGPYFTATSTTATSTFAGGLTAASSTFNILQNGKVGIGTESPGALLELSSTNNANVDFFLTHASDVVTNFPDIRFRRSRGTVESPTAVQSGDRLGGFGFNGHNGSAYYTADNAVIRAFAAEDFSTTTMGTYLTFETTPAGSITRSERMRIDASGSVGVGTTTPWGKLSITGSGTGTGLAFAVADSANTPRFVIQDNGNVGIGTTSPATTLAVNGNASVLNGNLGIGASFAPAGRLYVIHSQTDLGYGDAAARFVRQTTATNGKSRTVDFALQSTGTITDGFGPSLNLYIQGNGDALTNIANISGVRSGTLNSGALVFDTANGGSPQEKMRIDPSGNVGIGTTTPWGKLSVKGSGTGTGLAFAVADSANTPRFVIQDNGNVGIGTTSPSGKLAVEGSGGSGVDVLFKNSGGGLRLNLIAEASSADINFGDNASYVGNGRIRYDNSTNDLSLMTNGGERLRITAAGNVGIGTTTPGAKLHVLESSGEGNPAISPGEILRLQRNSASNATAGMFIIGGTQATNYIFLGSANGYSAGGNITYNNASDYLTLGTAGAEKLRITSTGNVGIGSTTPTGGKLVVSGTSGTSPLYLQTNDSANNALQSLLAFTSDNPTYTGGISLARGASSGQLGLAFLVNNVGSPSEAMRIANTGNVGIGTTSPSDLLHLNTAGGGDAPRIKFTNGVTGYASTDGAFIGISNSNQLDLWNNESNAVRIGTANAERLRIDSSGNVGIGTTVPTANLAVSKSYAEPAGGIASTTIAVFSNNNVTNGTSSISILSRSSAPSTINFGSQLTERSAYIDSFIQGGSPSIPTNSLVFGTAQTNRLVITGTGNIGIGTTTPWGKLSITGSGTGTGLAFAVADSANTPRFVIQDNGNVGIGTTNPGATLSLGTSADAKKLLLYDNGNAVYGLGIQSNEMRLFSSGSNASITFGNVSSSDGTTYSEKVRITGTGNIGIGTTTPATKLQVYGGQIRADHYSAPTGLSDVEANSQLVLNTTVNNGVKLLAGLTLTNYAAYLQGFNSQNNSSRPLALQPYDGNVGIGTTTPSDKLTVAGNVGITAASYPTLYFTQTNTDKKWLWSIGGSGSQTDGFYIQENAGGAIRLLMQSTTGYLGLGTTTPTAQFSTTGTVRFAGLGSGGANLITDALGNVTAASDERLKDKQGDFTRGLAAINAISPVLYKWRSETGFDTQSTYAGFFAQNVQTAIPEAVSQDSRGYLTLADRPILAALVNATKEIGTITGAFKDSLIAWLGNASNGIGDLFAKDIYATNGTFDTTSTRKLCITDGANDNAPLCLTKSQLATLLGQSAAAGQSADSPSASAPAVAPYAPVIELNGNASSTIELGDTYNDLGARILAPESDVNLGIVVLLDGATTTAVSIDTTTPSEHVILYTVTSPTTGLTGGVLRTVIVSPAELSPAPAEDTNPFNAPPSNDNATSTAVVDVAA